MNILYLLGKRFSDGSKISTMNMIHLPRPTKKDHVLLDRFKESNRRNNNKIYTGFLHIIGKRFSDGSKISTMNMIHLPRPTKKDHVLLDRFKESNHKRSIQHEN